MRKTWIITPCFARWEMLEGLLAHVYSTPPKDVHAHLILDNYYPLREEENHAKIKELAHQYGCTLIDSGGDLGLHKSLNNGCAVAGVERDDILVGLDPDERPTEGFAEILSDIMTQDPSIAVLGATFWVIDERFNQGKMTEKWVGSHRVWYHPSVEMFGVVGWNYSFVHDAGGFNQVNQYYGHIESWAYEEWKKRGLTLAYTPDVRSDAIQLDQNDTRIFDPEYRLWKTAHVGGFKGSFADWIKDSASGNP